MNSILNWFRRHFSDPQLVLLAVLLLLGSLAVLLLGHMLAPVLASVVIAYLLEGPVGLIERHHVPRLVAVLVVFLSFVFFILFLLIGLLPLLWQQVSQLFQELPSKISWSQQELLRLPERYPDFISQQQVVDIINVLRAELTKLGQQILSLSVASLGGLIRVVVYIFLVPILVFFFLKDKTRLVRWFTSFLPRERHLTREVWREVEEQIGNYVRGKFWEILIVWAGSSLTFAILGLQFAMLVGLFVGLSVLIPYIGATVMTLPVAWIAYLQWGWSSQFAYVVIAYVIIQILDGNLLVTVLFSEVVDLHPVAIIVAVLVFGGLWGFWGVFFAIPLATLVQAVLTAWLTHEQTETTAAGDGGSGTNTGQI